MEPRDPAPTSDPVSYTCTCGHPDGQVLLFYRYYAAPPTLPEVHPSITSKLDGLAEWYRSLTKDLQLGGKIRIAEEGFNVTVGGGKDQIEEFVKECVQHWSFNGLGLAYPEQHDSNIEEMCEQQFGGCGARNYSPAQGKEIRNELFEKHQDKREKFFKPTPGCACVFGGKTSVRVVSEATPMGVTDYVPKDWSKVVALTPEEWHERCHSSEGSQNVLVDVRNHYESRIGYFVSPLTGEPALRPPIRRFSQWPQFVAGHIDDLKRDMKGKQVLTYCTGGIRCEKGVRWMWERLGEGEKVYTLKGGIAAYLEWMNGEVREGRKTPAESLFKGRNYVFDARGAVGLDDGETVVSQCLVCQRPSSRLDKCKSDGCHLVVVVCEGCKVEDARCCQDCWEMDKEEREGRRRMCACEMEREDQLWAGERVKEPRTQGWRKRRKEEKEAQVKVTSTKVGETT